MRKVASVSVRVRSAGGDWDDVKIYADEWAGVIELLRAGDEFVVMGVDYE